MAPYHLIFPVVFALKMCLFLGLLPHNRDTNKRVVICVCLGGITLGIVAIGYVGLMTNQPIAASLSMIAVVISMYFGYHHGSKAFQVKK